MEISGILGFLFGGSLCYIYHRVTKVKEEEKTLAYKKGEGGLLPVPVQYQLEEYRELYEFDKYYYENISSIAFQLDIEGENVIRYETVQYRNKKYVTLHLSKNRNYDTTMTLDLEGMKEVMKRVQPVKNTRNKDIEELEKRIESILIKHFYKK